MCVRACMCIRARTCIRTQTRARIRTHAYIHMHIHAYTHIQVDNVTECALDMIATIHILRSACQTKPHPLHTNCHTKLNYHMIATIHILRSVPCQPKPHTSQYAAVVGTAFHTLN